MTRDMKSTKRPPAKKKSGGGTLIGMFIGLVLGVCLAAGVVWYINKAPLPFNNQVQGGERPALAQPGQPLALPGKPGDPVPEKRFQFYDILQGKADAVPDKVEPAPVVPETAKPEAAKEGSKESRVPLFLQAGSFSTAQDADNQKAKLAFMGIQSSVQQVMIEDKTLYRVRIGPYFKLDELNKVRADLAKSGIEAQLSK
ncbi:SPOR domain-containing protein [Azonexus hydrophilus]|uniref:SPOR domain-containing protein n=1 Tax=Azonexus hydrophilus TaxID=418702 RepID=UPI0024928A82|nr:SPOR domain-containing protein [Azonexus hydrophilus]